MVQHSQVQQQLYTHAAEPKAVQQRKAKVSELQNACCGLFLAEPRLKAFAWPLGMGCSLAARCQAPARA